MIDAIIVGAGLFGQVINRHLCSLGMKVSLVDNRQPEAGSKPAACLMKPSWFSGLGKDVYEPSLSLLDKLYGVKDLSFKAGPVPTTVHWCNPRSIMAPYSAPLDVERVGPGWIETGRERFEARTIIVAAGAWSYRLVNVPGLVGRAGAAFLWSEASIDVPFIRPWAPYRQVVAFNRGDGLWIGDGTAIKPVNWSKEREAQSRLRCLTAAGQAIHGIPTTLYGIRPYVPKVKPAYLDMKPGLIVATGGAKNGTLAAGWCAHKIGEHLS